MFIIQKKTDSLQFYRANLMLFHPWRNEIDDLLKDFETCEAHFKAIEQEIISKKQEYNANQELVKTIETAVNSETLDNFENFHQISRMLKLSMLNYLTVMPHTFSSTIHRVLNILIMVWALI